MTVKVVFPKAKVVEMEVGKWYFAKDTDGNMRVVQVTDTGVVGVLNEEGVLGIQSNPNSFTVIKPVHVFKVS